MEVMKADYVVPEFGQQLLVDEAHRGDVHDGREDVVAALRTVHVVVAVH